MVPVTVGGHVESNCPASRDHRSAVRERAHWPGRVSLNPWSVRPHRAPRPDVSETARRVGPALPTIFSRV